MKKTIFKSLLATICLLCSTNASAYDFEADGIYYDVVSFTDLTCKVGYNEYGNTYKGDVVIPETVTYSGKTLSVVAIGNGAFAWCDELKSVTIPNTVTSIDESAFNGCSLLKNIEIPNSVTKIDNNAFASTGLTSIEIPNSVTNIGNSAFSDCKSLTSVTIPNSVTQIDGWAFAYCNHLTSIKIPNSVTELGAFMFYYCDHLTDVTISNSITSIQQSTFTACSRLTNIVIPASVTNIESDAFSECSSLSSIKITGEEVVEIGYNAFYGCNALTTFYCFSTTTPYIADYTFTNDHYMNLNLYVPQEALEAYQNADGWKNFWHMQGFDAAGIENVKAKGENAVYYDLRGNRLTAPKHGLNIMDGKKVMVK